jgi:hypothetical protein
MKRAILKGLSSIVAIGLGASFHGIAFAQAIQPSGIREIQEILREKAGRTPAQRKLDSHLHLAGQVARGALNAQAMPYLANVAKLLKFDGKGRVHVDIRGTVTEALLGQIAALGGTVESSQPKYGAIRAWIPLLKAEALAGRPDVIFIEPAAKAIHNGQLRTHLIESRGGLLLPQRRENLRGRLEAVLPGLAASRAFMTPQGEVLGSAPVDTNGEISEGADLVQNEGFTGSGVKVGVLSDGVDSLATLQAAGDLPANVTVLSGQAGTGDEGTAMLEIIYDLAPGAQLFFATSDGSDAQMATNIQNLAAAGCNIIVDDVTYFNEGVFQDGIIARAVNAVTANAVVYLSSAQNSGNLDSGTSGTWEGDFNGTGGTITVINTDEGKTVTVHAFDATHNYDAITTAGGPTSVKWSDPLGAACNDYDLFILDSTLSSVLESSTNPQNCTTDPYEIVSAPAAGNRIVVVLYSGSARALHVDTERARLAIGTSGATFGHNAAGSAVTVAATHAQSTIFTAGNQSPETYSSDGLRKIFYYPYGTPITPGNFLFNTNGGITLSKVDLTAADCGQSAVTGFNPFCGTSAAAPTAAAIAALVMSADPYLTPSQVISTMKSTALAAHAGFGSRTVGAGIVMANLSVNSVLVPAASISPKSIFFGTEPVGTNSLPRTVTLTNTGNASLSIYSYTIAGANFGDFTVNSTCGAALAAGKSCTFSILFDPTAAGPRKSVLVVSDNAPNSPQRVALTGVGVAATVSPAALNFKSRTVNTTSPSMNATITNNSSVTMHIWQIAITGPNAGDFHYTTNCGGTLAVGASCKVSVTFKPTATGTRTASLLFSDDAGGSPQAVVLTGGGLDNVITIGTGNAVTGNLSASAPAGHCNFAAPSDRYLLDLSGQSTPTVVTFMMTSAALDSFVCVLDASNNLLAQDDDSAGNLNSTTMLSLSPAKYYVEASSFPGTGSGSYKLSALVATIATPDTLNLGDRVVASLSSSAAYGVCSQTYHDPSDRWTFSLTAPTTITIDVSSTSFQTAACLLNSSNGTIAFDDLSGPNTNARLIYQNLGVGTYYLEVSSASSPFAGGPYTLSLQSGLPPGIPISLGQTLSGNLSSSAAYGVCSQTYRDPSDRWQFSLSATTTITITGSSTVFSPTVCLLNSTNGTVKFASGSGSGTATLSYTNLGAGTYYIEVSSASSPFAGGAYTLSLTSGTGMPLTGAGVAAARALSSPSPTSADVTTEADEGPPSGKQKSDDRHPRRRQSVRA